MIHLITDGTHRKLIKDECMLDIYQRGNVNALSLIKKYPYHHSVIPFIEGMLIEQHIAYKWFSSSEKTFDWAVERVVSIYGFRKEIS